MVAVVLLFVLWPSLIQCLISKGLPKRRGSSNAEYAHSKPVARQEKRQSTWWLPFFHFATTRWAIILLLLAVCMPVLGYGASRIRMSVSLRDLFSSRSKVLQDYAWLESNIGPLIPVEVILRFPESEPRESGESSEGERPSTIEMQEYARRFRDRAHMVERTRRRIDEMPSVGGTLAGTTFAPLPIPKIPTGRSIRSTARRGVIARQIRENRQHLVDTHFLYDERDESTDRVKEELWRISGRVKALGDLEYASFLRELQQEVNDFLKQDETAGRSGVTAEVTGGVFLVAMAQNQLLVDLKNSFLIAFLLIAFAMMVLTRSISAGVISMLPNVFPALLIFGCMGWMDVAVDIGTMMTASVALGIAVDDTSHFLTWLRRGLAQGLPRIKAIRYAYEQCATAMLVTSVICGLGILPFAFSPFVPVARFAVLMCVLLFAAIAANLLLLAAALASPAGRLLTVKREKGGHGHGMAPSDVSTDRPADGPRGPHAPRGATSRVD